LMVDDFPTLGYPTSPTTNLVGFGFRSVAKSSCKQTFSRMDGKRTDD
jgi:hypothetical protein